MPSYYGGQTLSREQLARMLHEEGVRGDDLWKLVAIAGRESSYNTGAHRTDQARGALSGDRGLFQINYTWDQNLIDAGIIRSKADLFDPSTNIKAALFVLNRQGYGAWGMGSSRTGGSFWDANGDPLRGTDTEAARRAVQTALGEAGLQPNPSATDRFASEAGAPDGPIQLPTDVRLVAVGDGWPEALFNLGNGLWMKYHNIGQENMNLPIERVSREEYRRRFGSPVFGGLAAELSSVRETFGSFKTFWDSVLNQTIGTANPARNDPGVLKVIAQFAARPDMSQAELENRLRATSYWNSKTESELEWNSIPEGERNRRRRDTVARMQQAWWQFGGERLATSDRRIRTHLEAVASGKMGFGQWTESFLKPRLGSESPFGRQVRAEQVEQRSRGVDVENTAQQVRDTMRRWGLNWNERTILNWARDLVDKKKSDKDLIDRFSKQAQALYPWKDPSIETVEAAGPWIDTYSRVLEREGSLETPEVRRALQGRPEGVPVWEFETQLKKSSKWLETRNAREELFTLGAEAGRMFGFE